MGVRCVTGFRGCPLPLGGPAPGRLLLVPLYPQYAAATTATVCDAAFATLAAMRNQPTLRVVPPYYAEPAYIEALASSIETALKTLPFKPELILASFHGIPKSYVDDGDP